MIAPRLYNASQISAWLDCESLWYYEFRSGRKAPDVEWAVIDRAGADWQNVATAKQRALSLGQAAHDVLEAWYRARGNLPAAAWKPFPARVVHAGLHLLPHPTECDVILPEVSFELPCADVPGLEDWPHLGFRGTCDLRAKVSQRELTRLGIVSPSGWVLVDFKTSADVRPQPTGWAKTAEMLHADPQGTIYPLYGMVSTDVPALPSRWVYFETKAKRRAAAVDFLPTIESATAGAKRLLSVVQTIDDHICKNTPVTSLAQNPGACERFGGCSHHVSRRGPCPGGRATVGAARWKIVGRTPARAKTEDTDMSFAQRQAQMKAEREAAAKAKAQAAPESEPEETEDELEHSDGPDSAEPAEEEEAAPPPKPPAKAKPAPAAAKPKPTTTVAPLAKAAAKLTEPAPGVNVELTITSGAILIRMPVPADLRERAEAVIAAVRAAAS